jgi:putative transposase
LPPLVLSKVGAGALHPISWRKKFGGLEVSEARRLKQLEDENRRLKKVVADLSLDKEALKEVLSRKW